MPLIPPTLSVRFIPSKADWAGRCLARLVWLLVHGMGALLRWRWTEAPVRYPFDDDKRVIFAIWHNRLGLALLLYQRRVGSRYPGRRMAGLVSASRDGGLLARGLELFNVVPIRGSSSRRGAQAIRELVTAAEAGCDLAITPDGPRGPKYVVNSGVIAVAQLTGRPIVPVSYHLNWKYRLASWDQFQIPIPFARVDVALGEPLWVPKDAGETERETLRVELQRRLVEITRD